MAELTPFGYVDELSLKIMPTVGKATLYENPLSCRKPHPLYHLTGGELEDFEWAARQIEGIVQQVHPDDPDAAQDLAFAWETLRTLPAIRHMLQEDDDESGEDEVSHPG